MTAKEMRGKKAKELRAFIDKWGHELALLKVRARVGQCEKPTQIPFLKREIARAKTILKETEAHGGSESK